jgi:flagellar capping protein FliD
VYVGAVAVLFLFGLMLTRAPIGREALDSQNRSLALAVSGALFVVLTVLIVGAFGDERTAEVTGPGIADIGISIPKSSGSTSADGKAGRLVLDEAKLTQALEADWTAVSGFFDDFAADVEAFVKKQTGGSGVIDERLKSSTRNLDRLKDQVEVTNERLDAKETRMRAQFAAMELALQNSQTQQSWLSGQLAALNQQLGTR